VKCRLEGTTGSAATRAGVDTELAISPGAQEYGRLNAGKGILLVRITPEKVVSENNITGEQEQATIMSTGRR
jgi:hypothetical protein